jgi:hypothetical protein
VLRALATQFGLPLAFYGDRLNVFIRNDPYCTLAEQLRGAQDPTHFGRMLRALGIGDIIHIDVKKRRLDVEISAAELKKRLAK